MAGLDVELPNGYSNLLELVKEGKVTEQQLDSSVMHGVTVTNTPGPVTAPTANVALGLMIDAARRLTECDRKLRTLRHEMKIGVLENLGVNISGKTLGIVGMGRIGTALAKRAVACEMTVLYHNRHPLTAEKESALGVRYASMEELLAQSDFVSVNAPYTPETYHIIGEAELKQMKKTAILINTSRGPLVDEHVMTAACLLIRADGIVASILFSNDASGFI